MVSLFLSPLFIGWIFLSVICGVAGSGRRTGFWGSFILSMVISPLLVLLMLLIFQPVNKGK